MKKRLKILGVVIGLCLALSFNGYAVEIESTVEIDLATLTTSTGIVVNTTATVRSNSIPLPRDASFSMELLFTSSGTVDVLVDAEQGNSRPATEATSDSNFVIPENTSGSSVGRILAVTNTNVHIINFSPVVSGYFRLKLTGQGTNAADTTLTRARLVYVKGQ